jgi:hypothetical protein
MGLLLPLGLRAQDQVAELPVLDETTRLEVQQRLDQFTAKLERIYYSCKARLPLSGDASLTDSYIKMQEYRLRSLEQNLKSLNVRWNNYYPLQQWEISQDEGLMSTVERLELMKQEASDSLEVRKQMLQALQDFVEAQAYMASLDSTYNRLGKQAFELSLTSKTAPLLEKEKKKEQLLFATVQEKFDKGKMAFQLHLVSDAGMESLEDSYAVLKNKSDTIQAMQYKPLIQRIKDYLMGLAAVAVLLMFVSMMRARIKSAREMRKNMQQYKDKLKLNGQDEYPTI